MATALASTWGRFRCAYSKNTPVIRDCTVSQHNVTYNSGMKSASDGSGLIRFRSPDNDLTPASWQPDFTNLYSPPLESNSNVMILRPELFKSATVETEAQLIGETITLTGGSMVIDSSLFNSSGSQFYADGSIDYGTITAIGKLTAF